MGLGTAQLSNFSLMGGWDPCHGPEGPLGNELCVRLDMPRYAAQGSQGMGPVQPSPASDTVPRRGA
jgi:hypothetical protein